MTRAWSDSTLLFAVLKRVCESERVPHVRGREEGTDRKNALACAFGVSVRLSLSLSLSLPSSLSFQLDSCLLPPCIPFLYQCFCLYPCPCMLVCL